MADLAYETGYAMSRVEARMQLVRTCQETGSLSETPRVWVTSRHTVRKGVRRYEAEGRDGLQDRSHRSDDEEISSLRAPGDAPLWLSRGLLL